ncbi:MAG: ABC transporter ATP-binding protein [Anaerolineales bacterium]|nr:ABC transporter ATP-binding protein [Anaerolineales bacterium]
MSTTVLQTEGLTKRYGSLTAVDDLSLEVHEGEVLGFLGPNGAGKTTSINMICGLLKPDAGRVLLRGEPVLGGDRAVRTRVGMCPQDIVLWERLTCIEQLQFVGQMYGLKGAQARRNGETLLAELDLIEKRDKQARTLSGGMQRRLNLAMALVHDPEIIVLDEPEAGLDPQSRVKVREYIQSLARAKTIILTTHNMDEAERLADRVAIIDHGKLLVLDSPEALKRRLGEGDVLEMSLDGGEVERQRIAPALASLNNQLEVEMAGNSLIVRALNVVNLLPRILEALAALGVQPGEVRLRQNTLEDVFIQLTGRRLRQ